MFDRRNFLKAAGSMLCIAAPSIVFPEVALAGSPARTLWLRNAATGDEARVIYEVGGKVDQMAYYQLCYVLRDVPDARVVQMHLPLLHLLSNIQMVYYQLGGSQIPISVHSGFRTERHNLRLEGAAKNSYHLYGWAADISIAGLPIRHLARIAGYVQAGGIGIYDSFLHVDNGPRRVWLR